MLVIVVAFSRPSHPITNLHIHFSLFPLPSLTRPARRIGLFPGAWMNRLTDGWMDECYVD